MSEQDNKEISQLLKGKYIIDTIYRPRDETKGTELLLQFNDGSTVKIDRVGYDIRLDYTEVPKIEYPSSKLTPHETLEHISKYIAAHGFSFPDKQIENLYLSLRSKPFVLLAGISGTGKTRLAQLFAEAIGAEFVLIPVHPEWNDNSDLVGYCDLHGRFQPGRLTMFIEQARQNIHTPHIVCLDEMNLARVEHYFSDFLSIVETRYHHDNSIATFPLLDTSMMTEEDAARFSNFVFPENVYVVGTVNMDETTHPFSRKVLDRANTIEFTDVRLPFTISTNRAEPLELPNSFLRADFITLNDLYGHDPEFFDGVISKLSDLNARLNKGNFHIGYRVRDEICFYMHYKRTIAELLTENDAFDFQICQKILPRIQGSSQTVLEVLVSVFEFCTEHSLQAQELELTSQMRDIVESGEITYPRASRKIALMVERFVYDGFTSFWV